MLYKFKSKATGDLIMLEPNGRQVLEIIGKDAGPKGIVTVAEMPGAISALEAAIQREEDAAKDAEAKPRAEGSISLKKRALPFIDMLRSAQKSGEDVVWGV